MERKVLIDELARTDQGIETVRTFPEEDYLGVIEDYGVYYLITKRGEDILAKECVVDPTVEVTPNGMIEQAELFFVNEENLSGYKEGPARALVEQIEANGKPKDALPFDQNWDFHAHYVNQQLYSEIKEMKRENPRRTIRDGFIMETLEAKANERNK